MLWLSFLPDHEGTAICQDIGRIAAELIAHETANRLAMLRRTLGNTVNATKSSYS